MLSKLGSIVLSIAHAPISPEELLALVMRVLRMSKQIQPNFLSARTLMNALVHISAWHQPLVLILKEATDVSARRDTKETESIFVKTPTSVLLPLHLEEDDR